jgi:DNA-binding beta-propeller fold protein YncE
MRVAIRSGALSALACLLLAGILAPTAQADRELLSQAALETAYCLHCTAPPQEIVPPAEGQIEGPCGLATSPTGRVYVADYYHRVIDVFGPASPAGRAQYLSQIALPGANPSVLVNTLDSVCGLAFDSAGNLYGNEWHQSVVRLTGGEATIDSGEATGLAIDSSTDRLYVDDRTYIAEYALPFSVDDEPVAKIGAGSLGDGYSLAAADGRVYVADAADETVKVFDPATPLAAPVATIADSFNSLEEAALAVDPTNGHLLVVDNLQPGFEHPESAVLEFASGVDGYAFLGQLPGAPVHGGPSGITVDAGGGVLVTDGNGELSNAFLYSDYTVSAGLVGGSQAAPSTSVLGAGFEAAKGGDALARRSPGSASASEVSQNGGIRVSFEGNLAPRRLPRHGRRPVTASVGAKIAALGGQTPPQLRKIEIAINRNGHFSPGMVPACRVDQIQPATNTAALAACRRSLVGEGSFSARVLLPEQAPFPAAGKVYAFNGRLHGRPAILAHVYGTEPVPVSYTIPFELLSRRGTYGTLLRASLPEVTGNSGYITGLSLTFGGGRRARGFVTAGCPVPAGLGAAAFPFARVDFSFAGSRRVGSTLIRTCRGKG